GSPRGVGSRVGSRLLSACFLYDLLLLRSEYTSILVTLDAGNDEKRADVTAFELQLQGYRLTTAEIIYRLPDHPALLQSFIWQKFDLAPDYPELRRFLEFWNTNIEGKLHSVNVRQSSRTGPARFRHVKHAL